VNEAGGDYHLKSGSPAIDTGQTQANVPADLEGRARPIGPAYDIGCYEFAAPTGMSFFTVTPCRIVDTRNANGPFGGPALVAGAQRTFTLRGRCGVPATARSVSLNVTVTAPTASGDLKLFAGGTATPVATTINYGSGQTRANNAQPALSGLGTLAVLCDQASGSVQLIIDVNGYFR